jgi:hypothetical protein
MARLGLTQTMLSAYCGIPVSKLSPWFQGTRDISNLEVEKIHRTIDDLRKLEQAAQPWPISFADVSRIKELLERLRNGEFAREAV